jgi:hypothetical protein
MPKDVSMTDFSSISLATSRLIEQLSNLTGIIDQNYQSACNIQLRYKRKRMQYKLEKLLQKLVSCREYNSRIALWDISRLDNNDYLINGYMDHGLNSDLNTFLEVLMDIHDFLIDNCGDLIKSDYKIFENVQDSISARINIVSVILDEKGTNNISHEKLIELTKLYHKLIEHLDKCKVAVSLTIDRMEAPI